MHVVRFTGAHAYTVSEPRRLENRTTQPAVVLLVMPLSDSERARDLSINNS